jgi:hypothetical protein
MSQKIRHALYFHADEVESYLAPGQLYPTLDVSVSESIFNEMSECLYDFQSEWHKKPGALLLSPIAFLQFKHEVERSPWTRIHPPCAAQFDGIPVFCADIRYRVLPILPEYLVAPYEWKRQQNTKGFQ